MSSQKQCSLALIVWIALESLFTISCAQPKTGAMVQKHQTDSAEKTTAQRLRQSCISQASDRTVKDKDGVKICSFTGAKDKPYEIIVGPRKFKMSKQVARDGSYQGAITLNASLHFLDSKVPTADQAPIRDMIKNQCTDNIRYFWSKHEINLTLNLQLDDSTQPDQQLSVEALHPLVPTTPTDFQKDSQTAQLDYEIKIDPWPEGPKFKTAMTKECIDQAEVDTKAKTKPAKEKSRADCMKKLNQDFCLGINKMIGHFLGAEDKSDLACYPAAGPAKTDSKKDPKTDTPVADKSKDSGKLIVSALSSDDGTASIQGNSIVTPAVVASAPAAEDKSFMSFSVHNPLVKAIIDAAKEISTSTTTAPAAPAPVVSDSQNQAILAGLAEHTDAGIADSGELIRRKPPTEDPIPATQVDPPQDQSKDPSFEKWIPYSVTNDDMAAIFNCDYSKKMELPKARNAVKPTPPTQRQSAKNKRGTCEVVNQLSMKRPRVISMVPSWTETLVHAGVDVVGRTRYCIHPKNNKIQVVGGTKDWNIDIIQKLGADFILLDREENPKSMFEANLAAYVITDVQRVSDVGLELEKMAEKFDNLDLRFLANRWGHATKSTWHHVVPPGILEWIKKPEILDFQNICYVIWKNPWMSVSKDTFIASMLSQFGFGDKLIQNEKKYFEFDMAALPEKTLVLFSSEPYPFLKKRQGLEDYGDASAIINGEGYSWFGLRSLLFLEEKLLNKGRDPS